LVISPARFCHHRPWSDPNYTPAHQDDQGLPRVDIKVDEGDVAIASVGISLGHAEYAPDFARPTRER
jgi:hypothetical protein